MFGGEREHRIWRSEFSAGLPDVAAAGFNVIQSYQFEGDLNGPANTIEDARSYLDAAYKSGLKVLMRVPQECVSKRNLPCIKKRVSALKDHRALFGWQLYDEPDTPAYDLHGKEQGPAVPPKNLVEAYKTIKQHQGRTYLLTVNPSRGPVQLQIRFALDRFPNPRITLLPEGQRIPFQSGSFNAQWSPYDVRIYEIVSGRP